MYAINLAMTMSGSRDMFTLELSQLNTYVIWNSGYKSTIDSCVYLLFSSNIIPGQNLVGVLYAKMSLCATLSHVNRLVQIC